MISLRKQISRPFVNPLSRGIIARYSFDNVSGKTIHDSGPAGIDLTSANTPTLIAGKVGDAMQFNGSTDRCLADGGIGSAPPSITLAAWTWCNSLATNIGAIFDLAKTAGSSWRFCFTGANPVSSIGAGTPTYSIGMAAYNANGWVHCFDPSALTYNAWHHYAFTWDGATMNLYKDGVLIATTPTTGAISYVGQAGLGVGGRGASINSVWYGALDEGYIYGRVLSLAEIKTLANP
jgi:hypothetical protein